MSQYLLSDEEEPKSWVIPLVFAMITIPFLMAGCEEKKRDCLEQLLDFVFHYINRSHKVWQL